MAAAPEFSLLQLWNTNIFASAVQNLSDVSSAKDRPDGTDPAVQAVKLKRDGAGIVAMGSYSNPDDGGFPKRSDHDKVPSRVRRIGTASWVLGSTL